MFLPCHFFLLIGAVAAPAPPGSEYLFPLERPARVTGSFAESRGLCFHAGLDLSTEGKTGLPVRAGAAGSLYRLRVSPFGYGKAVYISFDDGRYGVYAHLSEFSASLSALARRKQAESSKYEIDCYFPKGLVPLKRGEIIGYSGDSGAPRPHLHFELRDGEERPLNPLTHGLAIRDARRPVIEGVALRPLDSFSGVNSTREVLGLKKNDLRPSPPLTIWGRVGLAVAAVVPSEGNRLGVWKTELWVDGKLIFANQYECFSYEQYRQAPLIYDRELALRGWKDYQRLYRRQGDRLPFHPPGEAQTGVLQTWSVSEPNYCGPGEHAVRIVAREAGGAADEVEFTLRAEEPELWGVPPRFASELAGISTPRLLTDFGETYAVVYAGAPGAALESLSLSYQPPAGPGREVPLLKASGQSRVGSVELSGQAGGPAKLVLVGEVEGEEKRLIEEFPVQPLTPLAGGAVNSPDGGARIECEPGAVYAPVFPRVAIRPPPRLPGLKAHSPVYVFEPPALAFRKEGRISLRGPRDKAGQPRSRLGVYRLTGDGFTYLGNNGAEPGDWFSAATLTLGEFCLLEDSVPPEIDFQFPEGEKFASLRPALIVRVKDEGSGLDYSRLKARLNGEEVPAEYVPYRRLIRYRSPEELKPGKYKFSLVVADKAGNVVREEREFETKRAIKD